MNIFLHKNLMIRGKEIEIHTIEGTNSSLAIVPGEERSYFLFNSSNEPLLYEVLDLPPKNWKKLVLYTNRIWKEASCGHSSSPLIKPTFNHPHLGIFDYRINRPRPFSIIDDNAYLVGSEDIEAISIPVKRMAQTANTILNYASSFLNALPLQEVVFYAFFTPIIVFSLTPNEAKSLLIVGTIGGYSGEVNPFSFPTVSQKTVNALIPEVRAGFFTTRPNSYAFIQLGSKKPFSREPRLLLHQDFDITMEEDIAEEKLELLALILVFNFLLPHYRLQLQEKFQALEHVLSTQKIFSLV